MQLVLLWFCTANFYATFEKHQFLSNRPKIKLFLQKHTKISDPRNTLPITDFWLRTGKYMWEKENKAILGKTYLGKKASHNYN